MKKWLFLFFAIPLLVQAQTRYYLPVPIASDNNRPFTTAQTIVIYDNTGTTPMDTCTWYSGVRYYYTTDLPGNNYDIKIKVGSSYYTLYDNIWLGPDIDITGGNIFQAADTVSLKLLTSGTEDTLTAYLSGLSATNSNGGGFFVQIDSAYVEGVFAFDNATAGKQWVRQEYLDNPDVINIFWAGADPTYTNSSSAAIQSAIDNLDDYGGTILIPEGNYKVDATISSDKPNLVIQGIRKEIGWSGVYGINTTRVFGSNLILTAPNDTLMNFYYDELGESYKRNSGPIIEFINFYCNTADSSGFAALRISGKYQWNVSNCAFIGFVSGTGIYLGQGKNSLITGIARDNYFANNHIGIDGAPDDSTQANAVLVSGGRIYMDIYTGSGADSTRWRDNYFTGSIGVRAGGGWVIENVVFDICDSAVVLGRNGTITTAAGLLRDYGQCNVMNNHFDAAPTYWIVCPDSSGKNFIAYNHVNGGLALDRNTYKGSNYFMFNTSFATSQFVYQTSGSFPSIVFHTSPGKRGFWGPGMINPADSSIYSSVELPEANFVVFDTMAIYGGLRINNGPLKLEGGTPDAAQTRQTIFENADVYGDTTKIYTYNRAGSDVRPYGESPMLFRANWFDFWIGEDTTLIGNKYTTDFSQRLLQLSDRGNILFGRDADAYNADQNVFIMSTSPNHNAINKENTIKMWADTTGGKEADFHVMDDDNNEYNLTDDIADYGLKIRANGTKIDSAVVVADSFNIYVGSESYPINKDGLAGASGPFSADSIMGALVDTSSIFTNAIMKYNGTNWAMASDATGSGGSAYADSVVHDSRHVTGDSLITDDEGDARFLGISTESVDVDTTGTKIAAALAARLETGAEAVDVDTTGTKIADALLHRLERGAQAVDVDTTGTEIAAALGDRVETQALMAMTWNLTAGGLDSSVINTGDTLCLGRVYADFTADSVGVFCTKPDPSFSYQIYHGLGAPGTNTAMFSGAQAVSAKNATYFTSFSDATFNKGEWIHIVFTSITTKPKNVGFIIIGTRD